MLSCWDCHGLPIEWKIEEQYRKQGRNKDEVPINEFRRECRAFAEHWVKVQTEEFKRLGVEGNFADPYLTMTFAAEATIARELLKFAMNGSLYRGSKPVMWSVVERTALAEAEVEYEDYQSDTIWTRFAVKNGEGAMADADVVIWTTTPWTIPGNRAITYGEKINYGVYEVTDAPEENWCVTGDKLMLADKLAGEVMSASRVDAFERVGDVPAEALQGMVCAHPFHGRHKGYTFDVPLLPGDHVTDEAGTGFVHTAPGHGVEDFEAWMNATADLRKRGIDPAIPFTVGADGRYTKEAPGFTGAQVINDDGKKGDANKVVIDALVEENRLAARGRLKHSYPHSWRSKKPVIYRNTPQWFVAMDKPIGVPGKPGKHTIRDMALAAIDATQFVPQSGQNRLRGMIEGRPDWVLSRQRAWGVPITVFVHKKTGDVIPNASWEHSDALIERITTAFETSGADAWFKSGAKAKFLKGLVEQTRDWEQVTDILDVWFDSGSTHAFVLEDRDDLRSPADVYLEGSDQHRGWFHSSLLESCGTRGRAPYDTVITHGFTMAEDGRKMSKSLGNTVAPQDIIKQYGADILRLWVMTTDYADDQRIGPEILKSAADAYRKLRNTFRFLLGNLHHHDQGQSVPVEEMPELERLMLHQLHVLDQTVREGYRTFDFKRIFQALFNFATIDLSAFYLDVRKDALYCDAPDSLTRRACLTVMEEVLACLSRWLAPMLVFTCEEVWLERERARLGLASEADVEGSVHLLDFPDVPAGWAAPEVAARWQRIRQVRRVVTGALEIERREKRIGSSLDAKPTVAVDDATLRELVASVPFDDVCITSGITLTDGDLGGEAFRLDDVPGVAVEIALADGERCARCRKITGDVGTDPEFPALSVRDAQAVRAMRAAGLVEAC
ncbi:MAG: isoleucine--tRNA ligase [Pseudomonadota bacterium]